ncbi:MAG: hypothetical protein V2I62_03535 [Bacteroidales bacterium]|jgi:hypothetical protein|nr:hypothetical protein [Bacteroidales bacterium]
MKKLNCLFIVGLVLLLIAGCSKQDVQSDALKSDEVVTVEKAKPAHYVPFNATFEISVDLESVLERANGDIIPDPPFPPTPPPFIPYMKYLEVFGDGNASHLGNTNVKLEQWWRPNLNPPPPSPGDDFYIWRGIGCGEIYFTAANGDLLLADYNDAIAVHLAPDYVETTLNGSFKDGGTGRFANAEGNFLWEVEYYPLGNFGTVTVSGTIKYSK